MLTRDLPIWKYVVLVLTCASVSGLSYFNALDYTQSLTQKQRILNSVCLCVFVLLATIIIASTGFYSTVFPRELEAMDS